MRSASLVFTLLAVASAESAQAAEFRGSGTVWLGPGFDTNAARNFVSPGVVSPFDFFAFGAASLQGEALGEGRRAAGSYEVTGRKFVMLPSEDTLIQVAQLQGLQHLHPQLSLGVSGLVRDRRGAERDYTQLAADLMLDLQRDDQLALRLRGGGTRFLFHRRHASSFFGPQAALTLRYRFTRRHTLSLQGGFQARTFNASAAPPPDEAPLTLPRADSVFQVGAQYAYRGPWQLNASYAYLDQSSNSYGETLRSHRFSLTAGLRLPWRFVALGTAVVQLTRLPEGISLPDTLIGEDDENASAVTAKLVRPLGERVELDVRYGFYFNVLRAADFTYRRHVITLGLTLRL